MLYLLVVILVRKSCIYSKKRYDSSFLQRGRIFLVAQDENIPCIVKLIQKPFLFQSVEFYGDVYEVRKGLNRPPSSPFQSFSAFCFPPRASILTLALSDLFWPRSFVLWAQECRVFMKKIASLCREAQTMDRRGREATGNRKLARL